MKIWHLKFEVDDYDNFVPVKSLTYEDYQSFDGRKLLKDWEPLLVRRAEPEKKLSLGDAPGFRIPVFGEKALKCLLPLIKEHVEILPLVFSEGSFNAINVTTVLNPIDYEKSEYLKFSEGNRIMMFEKYAFIPEKVKGFPIFKIVDEARSSAFVSDDFKRIVDDNRLKGFRLMLVWDSEEQ